MAKLSGVTLEKVARRHMFILGKSTVLESSSALELESGRLALEYVRRDGTSGIVPMGFRTFEQLVSAKRAFERDYLTAEVPAE